MIVEKAYNRSYAYEYAQRWAESRNPLFYNFTGIGGDCTNFISQCVYAGSCVMNFSNVNGWYYISSYDRAPSWTGVEFFYDFIINNRGVGPYAIEVNAGDLDIGDVIQLGNEEGDFYHSLLVTGFEDNTYLISAHSYDALNRRLDTYNYSRIRYLHIVAVRMEVPNHEVCFNNLIEGIKLS